MVLYPEHKPVETQVHGGETSCRYSAPVGNLVDTHAHKLPFSTCHVYSGRKHAKTSLVCHWAARCSVAFISYLPHVWTTHELDFHAQLVGPLFSNLCYARE